MPTYIGFSTQKNCEPRSFITPGVTGGVGGITQPLRIGKKFKLTDEQLVIQDLINAFSIKQGDKVGQPQYGTTIWTFIFEPNTSELRTALEQEIRRVASLDPRLVLNTINVYEQENGVLVELELAITPFNVATQVGFFLNRYDGSIQQLAQ